WLKSTTAYSPRILEGRASPPGPSSRSCEATLLVGRQRRKERAAERVAEDWVLGGTEGGVDGHGGVDREGAPTTVQRAARQVEVGAAVVVANAEVQTERLVVADAGRDATVGEQGLGVHVHLDVPRVEVLRSQLAQHLLPRHVVRERHLEAL